jgi:hypothetical protein
VGSHAVTWGCPGAMQGALRSVNHSEPTSNRSIAMAFILITAAEVIGLFGGMLVFLEAGRRLGQHQRAKHPESIPGIGAVDGAVFGLMGLLVAFTFSGAAARFDVRRHLIVEEANAIGTAYLRLDLLAPEARANLRQKFARYLDLRLETYSKMPDVEAALATNERALVVQGEIWSDAVTAARDLPQATMLLLPALNEMIDITTTRMAATRTHPPVIISAMLGTLALVCSLLAGYGMAGGKRRSWVHMLGFAGILAITIYVILDLEYPRLGLIQVSVADQALVELRQSFK